LGSFNETTLEWSLPFAFSEGAHMMDLTVFDGAGFSTAVYVTFTVDTIGPSLSVTSPGYSLTRTASASVSGATEVGATVTVNGSPATVDGAGHFTTVVTLAEGSNTIAVVATDPAGNWVQVTRTVTLDTIAPTLTVTTPAGGTRSPSNVVHVAGTTEAGASVSVNGAAAGVGSSGGFAIDIALPDGSQTITTVAMDAAGNSRTDTRTIDVGPAPDTTAPVVTVSSPADNARTEQGAIVVSGTVDDPGATVLVNGLAVHPTSSGSWSVTVSLVSGSNTITVSAVDAAGNQGTSVTRTVTFESPVPGISQAVTSLSGNLLLGLAIVLVALVGLVFAMYANLNRKIGERKPPMPPEGGEP